MTSKVEENKEFAKWLQDWISVVQLALHRGESHTLRAVVGEPGKVLAAMNGGDHEMPKARGRSPDCGVTVIAESITKPQ
jgi:hypothetical protein